jgi:cellulose synthase/poly-beta-1,6-N-acetylglucosamine synthase-like glycosyltransferase
MVAIIISAVIIAYTLLILIFWLGWEKSLPCSPSGKIDHPVSIIIAIRNEAENIIKLLGDIESQSYPKGQIEVVIVDDHSTDSSVSKIQNFANASALNLAVHSLQDSTGKKAAINLALGKSTHDIILTTDGDCRVAKHWVETMISCFEDTHVQLVSGPVRMYPQTTFLERLQGIEFSSLISAGAATLNLGWPTMANAANFAYRKSALKNIKEHSGVNTSSGDDVFLLHAISRTYKQGVLFCRDAKAIVDTLPSNLLGSFYHQRKRWASKWRFYSDIPTIFLAVFIFIVNISILGLPLLVYAEALTLVLAANLFVLKFVFEYLFLREVQKFFKARILVHEFIILAIVYPFYVAIVALSGLTGTAYNWKDRKTK